jgi:outer membrane protein OmpA-like peptidoglycan-associated protein
MNRFLIPLLILLGSLLLSWHWNCNRAANSLCGAVVETVGPDTMIMADTAVVEVDTAKTVLSTEEKLLMEPLDVYFAVSKSGISRNEEINNWLSTAKKYLEANPNERLAVTGHTDSDGDDAANVSLSESRAKTVADILTKEGFKSEALQVEGKGEAEPKVSNDTPENKAQNRRVSVRLIK